MGKESSIEWCFSSVNLQMGCRGCELWNKTKRACYAGMTTARYAGGPNYPARFEEPKLFLDRLAPALKWGPPTTLEREKKPWIPKTMPRLIFLNDMGDTFSEGLPENWLAPLLPLFAKSEHHFILLTKRPSKMVKFSQRFPLPTNVWPGTSVTSDKTAGRVAHLRQVVGGGPKVVSFEPMWGMMPEECFEGIQWAIFGGQSGNDPVPFDLRWLRHGIVDATIAGARVFVKQYGAMPIENGQMIELEDGHGGNWDEWGEEFRIRQFPIVPAVSLL